MFYRRSFSSPDSNNWESESAYQYTERESKTGQWKKVTILGDVKQLLLRIKDVMRVYV